MADFTIRIDAWLFKRLALECEAATAALRRFESKTGDVAQDLRSLESELRAIRARRGFHLVKDP